MMSMGKLKAFNQRIFHSQYSIMMIKFRLACSLFIYHVLVVGVEREETVLTVGVLKVLVLIKRFFKRKIV